MGARASVRSAYKNFNNKAYCLVPTTVVYMHIYGSRNHMDPCLQGSGDLCMCGSQTDQNIAQILPFLDNLLMFYQAVGVNLSFNRCDMFVAGGACAFIRYCASIRTYLVSNFTAIKRTICCQFLMILMIDWKGFQLTNFRQIEIHYIMLNSIYRYIGRTSVFYEATPQVL